MFGLGKLFSAASDLAAAITGLASTVRTIDATLRTEARLDLPAPQAHALPLDAHAEHEVLDPAEAPEPARNGKPRNRGRAVNGTL